MKSEIQHFLKISDLSKFQILRVLEISKTLKIARKKNNLKKSLSGKTDSTALEIYRWQC